MTTIRPRKDHLTSEDLNQMTPLEDPLEQDFHPVEDAPQQETTPITPRRASTEITRETMENSIEALKKENEAMQQVVNDYQAVIADNTLSIDAMQSALKKLGVKLVD